MAIVHVIDLVVEHPTEPVLIAVLCYHVIPINSAPMMYNLLALIPCNTLTMYRIMCTVTGGVIIVVGLVSVYHHMQHCY